jgi:hypothetical protein
MSLDLFFDTSKLPLPNNNFSWSKHQLNNPTPEEAGKKYEEFFSGAKRSVRMPRYDLIPFVALQRLAERYTGSMVNGEPDGGALKYGESNWKKGLPSSDVINHIIHHLSRWNEKFQQLKY